MPNPIQIAKKNIDEMVRDFTQVQPRTKSEVRRRILEYANQIIQSCIEAAPEEKFEMSYPEDAQDLKDIGFNECRSDFIAELKKGME